MFKLGKHILTTIRLYKAYGLFKNVNRVNIKFRL